MRDSQRGTSLSLMVSVRIPCIEQRDALDLRPASIGAKSWAIRGQAAETGEAVSSTLLFCLLLCNLIRSNFVH